MPTPRQLLTIALVVIMVVSAGCAGWGQDGPADQDDSSGPSTAPDNTTNESENESNETDTTNTTDNATTAEDTNTSEDTQSSESSDSSSTEDENEDENENENENEDGDGDPSTDTQDTSTSSQSAEADAQPQPDEDEGDGERDSSSTNSDEQEQDQEQESEPEPDLHTLTVSVTSPEGNAVEGADVSIVTYDGGESVAEATTNEDGQATFEVEDGDYEILVSNTQFGQPSDERLVTVDGEDTSLDVQMTHGGMYTYSMTVQVVDSEGNPIHNELVQIGTPGEADSTQHYITDENGEVTISFSNSSESDAVMQTVIVRAEPHSTSVTMGDQTEQITATGDRETYDLTVGAGAEGEDITVERWDGATTTKTSGEDGTATFTVYPGEYSVTSGDEQTEVTVDGDQEVTTANSSSGNSSANSSTNTSANPSAAMHTPLSV